MRMTGILAIASLMQCGCVGETRAMPDHRVPHQLSEKTFGTILVRTKDGTWTPVRIEIPAGWWIASPFAIE